MSYETPHQKHLRLAALTVGLRDMHVLEVGGCSPPTLLREYGPRTWTCFDLNPVDVAHFNAQTKTLALDNLTATVQDIATLEQSEQYDRIYSLNCFEHIGDLPTAFAQMYRALKLGGALYTLFGPIWSSDVGHHLSIPTDRGGLHFFDGPLEPWEHLTSTPTAIHTKLARQHGKSVADRAIGYIYEHQGLNRLYEQQYLEIIRASGFTPAMIIRNKKGRPPAVPGATRTREFAMVLKKGPARVSERMLYPMKFGWAYLTSRYARSGVCRVAANPCPADGRPGPPGAAADLRIVYMSGEYPRATDVFVQREVAGLRAAGVHVDTISIRRPSAKERGSEEQEAERRGTRYVLPVSPLALAAAHGSLFLRAPGRYLSTLAFALGRRPGGLRSLAYQCFYFAEAGVVAAHVRAKNFRHLHNHFEGSSCSVAMLASMLGGFTYSMTVHGPTVFFQPENWLLDEKARRALFVSCISHYCRSQVMIYTQEDKWERLHIVHCGVDPESFTPSPVRPGGANLLFVGRLASVKGLPVLLQAIARLRPRFPGVRLDIIGDGPDRSRLEAQAQALGVADRATFHGYRSQTQLREQLARTDAFVLSSFAEGVPVVLMEAMAAGVPVVATRIAGIPELVEHGECGLLVPPGDPAALADAIALLLGSDGLRARFAAAGRVKVEREFNLRHEVARLIEIMTQALRGRVAPVRPDVTEGAPARHPAA